MSNFSAVMDEQREYAKASIGQSGNRPYTPSPQYATYYYGIQDGTSLLSSKRNILLIPLQINAQDSATAEAIVTQLAIQDATLELEKSHATPDAVDGFSILLEQRKTYAKHNCERKLDRIFNDGIQCGEANPELQGDILNLTLRIGSLFNDLFKKIANLITHITRNVETWLVDSCNSIKNIFNSIKGWIASWF
ncbi:hypothetical protein [Collimonas arenae]|uniref:hypothetical protein n=1 Tax=Collimonas arenae TaxID=279058 RepID=UPI000570F9CE|nr:hypothetical protein [Collimonas arenae]